MYMYSCTPSSQFSNYSLVCYIVGLLLYSAHMQVCSRKPALIVILHMYIYVYMYKYIVHGCMCTCTCVSICVIEHNVSKL